MLFLDKSVDSYLEILYAFIAVMFTLYVVYVQNKQMMSKASG